VAELVLELDATTEGPGESPDEGMGEKLRDGLLENGEQQDARQEN